MRFWDEYKPTRIDQWDGELADVRMARYEGLATDCSDQMTAQAGALSAVLLTVILRLMPLSPVRSGNFIWFIILAAIYGAMMGIWRKRDLISGKRYYLFKNYLRPHTLFNYLFIPFVPVLNMLFLPELDERAASSTDTFSGTLIMILIFFWVGLLFDYLWEGFHNYGLARLMRNKPNEVQAITLRHWIMAEEKNRTYRIDALDAQDGKVVVKGWFQEPSELRRKLLLLDFVKEAKVEQSDQHPTNEVGTM
jgi:hypothetical protein